MKKVSSALIHATADIEGLIGIAAAAAVIVWPGLTLLTFAYIIAFGIILVMLAIKLKLTGTRAPPIL